VDEDFELLAGQTEKMVGFNHLQALVHHRRRIDRDLRPHRPVRVPERLLGRGGRHGLPRPVAERAAGSSQDDPLDFVDRVSVKRLKDRVVLRIDRQDRPSGLARRRHEEIAGADQAFLVGKRHLRSGTDCGERR
jgi:hypothetical protein